MYLVLQGHPGVTTVITGEQVSYANCQCTSVLTEWGTAFISGEAGIKYKAEDVSERYLKW